MQEMGWLFPEIYSESPRCGKGTWLRCAEGAGDRSCAPLVPLTQRGVYFYGLVINFCRMDFCAGETAEIVKRKHRGEGLHQLPAATHNLGTSSTM